MTDPIQFPDNLERRAKRVLAAMVRRANGDREWIEGTIDLAIELAGAREDHGRDDRAFGRWLIDRFGDMAPSKDDRAILIRWAKEPDKVRAHLQKCESRSLRVIDPEIFPPKAPRIFRNIAKDAPPRRSAQVADPILAAAFHTDPPDPAAKEQERRERERERAAQDRARRTEEARVFAEQVAEGVKQAQEKYAKFDFNFEADTGDIGMVSKFPLTMAEYRTLMKFYHPDNKYPSDAERTAAATILTTKKYQLTGEK
jgi:hypothetical protein